MMTHFNGLARDVWPLPPRGISIGRTNHRAGVLIQYTYLCDQDDSCMAVAFSQDSELHARQQVDGHKCPQTDGSRGLIPTGKTLVQKMWDEADDAMDAYRAEKEYKGMTGKELQGFIKGVAEVLTFCTVPCFKVTEDVLRELYRRWKMRQGEIPFAPTPSYNYHPYLDEARSHSIARTVTEKPAAKPARAPISRVAKAAVPAEVQLTAEERKTIRTTYHGGAIPKDAAADMLAAMFSISKERVISIAGAEPSDASNVVAIGALF